MLGSTRGVKEPSEERTRMKRFIRTSRGKGRPPLEKVLSFRSRLPTLHPYQSQRHVWELIFGSKERRCGETSVMALSFRRNKNGKWRKMMPRPRLLATPLPPSLSLSLVPSLLCASSTTATTTTYLQGNGRLPSSLLLVLFHFSQDGSSLSSPYSYTCACARACTDHVASWRHRRQA